MLTLRSRLLETKAVSAMSVLNRLASATVSQNIAPVKTFAYDAIAICCRSPMSAPIRIRSRARLFPMR